MPDRDVLLEVENLYTNFYTYSGVVKALDGVSFKLKKGETFGLVGETGCGKSVTANCVLRLIPSPPGKIESGSIYFMAPSGSDKEIEDLQARMGAIRGDANFKEGDARLRKLETELKEAKEVRRLRAEIGSMTSGAGHDPNDPRLVDASNQLRKIMSQYDLLARSDAYMRKIRGKYISMIFQEPMSALNPVFPAGQQIAEVLLLHEKKELAQTVLKNMNQRLKDIEEYTNVERVKTLTGEFKCGKCGAMVKEDDKRCPQCGGSFENMPFRQLSKLKISWNKRFYKKMVRDTDALSLRIASKIPLLRRYEKPMKAEALVRAERMLTLVRIPDPKNVVKSFPHELSGGMQQRVMIAMALACRPQMLIADEPTTALDVTIQAQILKLMKDLQTETGTSILLITHNLGVVAETCDRVGVMYAGVMAEIGTVDSIFKDPLHPYTMGLMKAIPKVTSSGERLESIEGSVPNLIKPPPGCRFNPRCPFATEICTKQKPPMVEVKPNHFVTCYKYVGGAGNG